MNYARFEIEKARYEQREKSVPIVVFSRYANQEETLVYAPKSRVIIEEDELKDSIVTAPMMRILVPVWVFSRAGVHASDASGFKEIIERTVKHEGTETRQ